MDPDDRYFPEPDEINKHAIAFARLMFAHASFEAEVRGLQGVITSESRFGEQPNNQLRNARKRPKLMARLIKAHRGEDLPEANPIATLLCAAIDPCDQRNFLAHGEWWCFNSQTSAIAVRSGTQREDESSHREFTAADIMALAETFETLTTELFKLRRSIEARHGNHLRKRLYDYLLGMDVFEVISDEMRAVVETYWPELAHKLPPRG